MLGMEPGSCPGQTNALPLSHLLPTLDSFCMTELVANALKAVLLEDPLQTSR